MEVVHSVESVVVLMGVAALTAVAAGKLPRLPLTIALVLVGLACAALAEAGVWGFTGFADVRLTPQLVLFVFIPTLIFESAYALDARQLRRNLLPVLTLAVPGLLISTFIIGTLMWLAAQALGVTGINFLVALLLGAILSATDPVAVIALFKQLGTPERLTVLVEGESLFNDATSLVLAGVLAGIVAAGMVTGADVVSGIGSFFWVFFGGVVVGVLAAWIAGMLMGLVHGDTFIEITLTTILAYAGFMVAEHLLHVSGIMAVVAAGIMMNSWGRTKLSPTVGHFMHHFWEYLASLANGLIFLMVGLMVDLGNLWDARWSIAAVVVAMLISRAIVVFGLVPLVGKLSDPVERAWQAVMYWGGLRGAIALAIVLALENTELRNLLEPIVVGAVLFTLLVQGLSIEVLVKRLGLDQMPVSDRLARLEGLQAGHAKAVAAVPALEQGGVFSSRVAEDMRQSHEQALGRLRGEVADIYADLDQDAIGRILMLRALARGRYVCYEMFGEGHLTEQAFRELDGRLGELLDRVRFQGELPADELVGGSTRRTLYYLASRLLGALPGGQGLQRRLRQQRAVRDYETAWGRHRAAEDVLQHLDELAAAHGAAGTSVDRVAALWRREQDAARQVLDETAEQFPEFVTAMQERLAQRLGLRSELSAVSHAGHAGTLPAGVAHALEDELQQELAQLRAMRGDSRLLTTDPRELLRKVPFFAGLPEDAFEPIAGRLQEATCPAGEDLIREGASGDSLFLIARGVIRVVRATPDGGEQELATLVAGDFFGEMALLQRAPRNATARAVTACTTWELKRDDLDNISSVHPAIGAAIKAVDEERRQANAGADSSA